MTPSIDASREIFCTRTYEASSELLLRMWSNPEHLTHWWGPTGFRTTTHEMDFKPGGTWRFTMHGPDGTDFPNLVRYTRITSDEIAYEHAGKDDVVGFTVKVKFLRREGETEMQFRLTFPSTEERQRVIDEFGAEEGLRMTMSRLDEYVADQDKAGIELVIVRKFKAPLETVWKAITEEDQISQWGCPMGLTMERSSDDLVPGGRWHSTMFTPTGYALKAEGEYLRVEPMTLLEYSHRWEKEDGSFKPTTLVSVKLSEHDGCTTMTFVQSGFWSEEARAAHLGGWSTTIHKLGVLVGATLADRTVSLVREFKAPIDLVWKCWTEPQHLGVWFTPRPYTCPKCEIDLRPGGYITLVMRSPDGMEHAMISEITDVEPNQSFGWVNSVAGFDGSVAIQGGTFVMFEDLGDTTKVTVNSYNSAFSEQGTMMLGGMEIGWNMSLDQLSEVISSL